jgi:plasmid maintenance system antidote protein VapI
LAVIETHDGPSVRFPDLLRGELLRRTLRNPRYSLRAYAKFLDVAPATLSQLLRGRRACTPRTIQRMGLRLGIDEATLAACQQAESLAASNGSDTSLRQLEALLRDTVEIASEWYHHAILELARADGFQPDSRRIASALGLTVDEVNVGVQRLARLGLLEMRGARWIVHAQRASGGEAFTTAALVRCHDLLGRLIDATKSSTRAGR